MGAKIISFALVCVLLISSFSVFAFADASVLSDDVYVDDYVSSDFNNYLNVEEYKKKAGTEGYTDLTLVGVSKPEISIYPDDSDPSYEDLRVSFTFYFYNPMLLPVDVYLSTYEMFIGHAQVKFPGDSGYKTVGLYNSSGVCDKEQYTNMFICGTVIHPLGKFNVEDDIDYSEYVSSLKYSFKDVEFITSSGKVYTFYINGDIESNVVDHFLETSSPLSDLATFLNSDVATIKENYPVSDSDDFSTLVFFYEDLTFDNLYLYVYDSLGRQRIHDTYSTLVMSFNDHDSKAYDLEWINTEESISKFKILNTSDIFISLKTSGERKYSVTTFFTMFLCGDSYLPITQRYKIQGDFDFTYTGNMEGRNVSYESNQIVLRDVGDTCYRLNNSAEGEGYYKTLSSVYFSIPNTYFELDDNNYLNDRKLERISGEFYSLYSDYILIARTKEYLQVLKKWEIKGRDINWWATNCKTVGQYSLECDICSYGFPFSNYNEKVSVFSKRTGAFYPSGDFENLGIEFSDEYINYKFDENDDSVTKVSFEFNSDDTFDLLARDSMTFSELSSEIGFLNAIWAKLFGFTASVDKSILDIKAFDTLSGNKLEDALSMSKEEFCDIYYVSENDYESIYLRMQNCLQNNETFIFFRFDIFDYYAAGVYFNVGDFSTSIYYAGDDVFACKTKMYKDFDIFELELKNSYDSQIYNVDMKPITFVSAVTTPDPFDPSEDLPSVEDVVSGLMPEFPTFDFSFLKPLAAIAGVVLLVVVVYFGINFAYKVSIIRSTNANVRSNKRKRNK